MSWWLIRNSKISSDLCLSKSTLQLEQNLISDGCRDPLTTWHGVIIDGHNRYELCRKHQIPFQ